MSLKKYTLSKNKETGDWDLKKDKTKEIIESYENKEEATKGGALSSALGSQGGSVKIKYADRSGYQEERTYPSSADPKSSKG